MRFWFTQRLRHALSLALVPSVTVLALAATVTTEGRAEAQDVKRLTLDQAIEIALQRNPDIAGAGHEIDAAEAARKSARGNYGPRVKLDASLQRWDSPVAMDLMGALVPLMDVRVQQWLGSNSLIGQNAQRPGPLPDAVQQQLKPTEVRAQVVWSAGVTVAQPLASLWTIDEGVKLRALGVDVAKIHRQAVERDTAFQVTEAYYRVLQAQRLAQVSTKSVEQVESQVKRAEAFYRQGTVGKNDLLRAELGLAAARQKQIQTAGMVSLAQGRLATLMGLPVRTTIEPVEIPSEAPSRPLITEAQAEEMAVSRRIELREIDQRIAQAEHSIDLAKSKMLPQVNAVANYTHAEGSAFQPENAWFVGGVASWDLWEGGATYYGIPEARARLASATSARDKARDMLRLDARNSFVNVTTAREALTVAEQAVTQAEENYRIESKRYEAANNTSFDVLDAETLLTNARSQREAALFDYVIATASLARAVGDAPGSKAATPISSAEAH